MPQNMRMERLFSPSGHVSFDHFEFYSTTAPPHFTGPIHTRTSVHECQNQQKILEFARQHFTVLVRGWSNPIRVGHGYTEYCAGYSLIVVLR
jgi:hypothetical protein